MAPPTNTWDATTPAGSDPKSQGDDVIRKFKAAILERCDIEHHFGGHGTGIDADGVGKHLDGFCVEAYIANLAVSLGKLSAAVQAALNPTGSIQMFGGAAAPTGWLLCNGAAVNRVTYAALFTAIGTSFGAGDGATTFNLPDLRGRVPSGVGTGTQSETRAFGQISVANNTLTIPSNLRKWITGMAVVLTTDDTAPAGLVAGNTYYIIRDSATTIKFASSLANAIAGTAIDITTQGAGNHTITQTLEARTLGEQGGEQDHALVTAEIPAHTHAYTDPTIAGGVANALGANDGSTNGGTSGSTGGSGVHNNLSPFVGLNYIIKT